MMHTPDMMQTIETLASFGPFRGERPRDAPGETGRVALAAPRRSMSGVPSRSPFISSGPQARGWRAGRAAPVE